MKTLQNKALFALLISAVAVTTLRPEGKEAAGRLATVGNMAKTAATTAASTALVPFTYADGKLAGYATAAGNRVASMAGEGGIANVINHAYAPYVARGVGYPVAAYAAYKGASKLGLGSKARNLGSRALGFVRGGINKARAKAPKAAFAPAVDTAAIVAQAQAFANGQATDARFILELPEGALRTAALQLKGAVQGARPQAEITAALANLEQVAQATPASKTAKVAEVGKSAKAKFANAGSYMKRKLWDNKKVRYGVGATATAVAVYGLANRFGVCPQVITPAAFRGYASKAIAGAKKGGSYALSFVPFIGTAKELVATDESTDTVDEAINGNNNAGTVGPMAAVRERFHASSVRS